MASKFYLPQIIFYLPQASGQCLMLSPAPETGLCFFVISGICHKYSMISVILNKSVPIF